MGMGGMGGYGSPTTMYGGGGFGGNMMGGGMMSGGYGGASGGMYGGGGGDMFGANNGMMPNQQGTQPDAQAVVPTSTERKRQRKMFILGAVLQMFSLLVNVIMQTLRGAQELAAIGFGTWFAVRTIRELMGKAPANGRGSLANNNFLQGGQHQAGMQQAASQVTAASLGNPALTAGGAPTYAMPSNAGVTNASSGSSLTGKVSLALVTAALYVAASYGTRAFFGDSGAVRRKGRKDATDDEPAERSLFGRRDSLDSMNSSSVSGEEEFSDGEHAALKDELRRCRARRVLERRQREEMGVGSDRCAGGTVGANRQVYVAEYDFSAVHEGRPVQFREGEQFVIDDYRPDAWCVGTRLGASADGRIDQERCTLPGNYLRALPLQQKF